MLKLIDAATVNMENCRKHWEKLAAQRGLEAKVKTWDDEGLQMYLTVIMGDVTAIFKELQKKCQLENIILPDVLKYRDHALKKLQLMVENPYPGGYEDKWLKAKTPETPAENEEEEDGEEEDGVEEEHQLPELGPRRTVNTLVTTFRRDRTAIRNEIVQSAINFLSTRLDLEQEEILKSMQKITDAEDEETFINIESAKPLFKVMPAKFDCRKFVDEVLTNFDFMKPPSCIKKEDYSVKLYHMLRHSRGNVRLLLSSLAVTCPIP